MMMRMLLQVFELWFVLWVCFCCCDYHGGGVAGDCMPDVSTLGTELDRWPIVVRVVFVRESTTTTVKLPCRIEIYQDGQYVLEDEGFTGFTIVEVLKQNWSEVGTTSSASSTSSVHRSNNNITDNNDPVQQQQHVLQPGMIIPIVYDTDTGFYPDLPTYLTNDGSFLAFLRPYRYCVEPLVDSHNMADASFQVNPYSQSENYFHNNNSNTTTTTTPFGLLPPYLTENPFLLNECNMANQPWSDLSEEDVAFLQSQEGYIPPPPEEEVTIVTPDNNNNNDTSTTTVTTSVNNITDSHDDETEQDLAVVVVANASSSGNSDPSSTSSTWSTTTTSTPTPTPTAITTLEEHPSVGTDSARATTSGALCHDVGDWSRWIMIVSFSYLFVCLFSL